MGYDWDNLEEKADQAICELMFSDRRSGAPTLETLQDIVEAPGTPANVTKRAAKLLELLNGTGPEPLETRLPKLTDVELMTLASELVSLLRFAARRGDWS